MQSHKYPHQQGKCTY